MPEINRAKTLHRGQSTRLIKITQAKSRYAERDVLVLMLGHYCGMRITEVSRLTVADVMHASGRLRSEVGMREAITKGCRQRCAHLASRQLFMPWKPICTIGWRVVSAPPSLQPRSVVCCRTSP